MCALWLPDGSRPLLSRGMRSGITLKMRCQLWYGKKAKRHFEQDDSNHHNHGDKAHTAVLHGRFPGVVT